jgi:transcriptional regulator with XRE-family HTH domain
MDLRALVARNIRRIRVQRGVSQEALAVDAEIDRTYMSRLERGMENPTLAVIERIAGSLSVPVTELFSDKGRASGPLATLKPGRKPRAKRP